ncbi:MAG: hypothetical protein ACKOSO_03010, partial [Actinomycetota bacterium]
LAAGLALPGSALALGPLQATVAAAGDIVCDPDVPAPAGECQQAQTRALVDAAGADRVLALGDLQYSAGSLDDFQTGYDRGLQGPERERRAGQREARREREQDERRTGRTATGHHAHDDARSAAL